MSLSNVYLMNLIKIPDVLTKTNIPCAQCDNDNFNINIKDVPMYI